MDSYIRFFKKALEDKNITVDADYFRRLYAPDRPQNMLMSPEAFRFVESIADKTYRIPHLIKKDLLLDINYLEEIFPHVYGGYDYFISQGLFWSKFFEDWRTSIARFKDEKLDIDASFTQLHRGPRPFIDNHLQFPFLGLSKSSKSATKIARVSVEKLRSRTADIFTNTLEKGVVTIGPEKDFPSESHFLNSNTHREYIEEFGPSGEVHIYSNGEYTYLRIPTFSARAEASISNLKIKADDFDGPLIIDIRSNGGLSNESVVPIINELAGVQHVEPYFKYFSVELKINPLVDCLADNFDLYSLLYYKRDTSPLDLQNKILKNLNEKPELPINNRDIYNNRFVYVISNRFVSSDGEALLHYLKCFKNVCVIGENTAGTCQFVQPGLLFLPNSKMPIFIPAGRNLMESTESIDGYGISPDVYVSEQAWKKDSILKFIRDNETKLNGI